MGGFQGENRLEGLVRSQGEWSRRRLGNGRSFESSYWECVIECNDDGAQKGDHRHRKPRKAGESKEGALPTLAALTG